MENEKSKEQLDREYEESSEALRKSTQELHDAIDPPKPERQPVSFVGIIVAVVVGIFIAALIL